MRQVVGPTLPPVTQDTAAEPARSMLENVQKQNGFIPNMYANMANSPGLLDTYYVTGYKRSGEHRGFTSVEQEVIFLTISNYSKHVLDTKLNERFADHAWSQS